LSSQLATKAVPWVYAACYKTAGFVRTELPTPGKEKSIKTFSVYKRNKRKSNTRHGSWNVSLFVSFISHSYFSLDRKTTDRLKI